MKTKFLFSSLTIIMVFWLNIQAQEPFKELESKNGVDFSYKWKSEKKNAENSPIVLMVKIKNNNDYKVAVSFTTDYYFETIRKASSEEQNFCINSKKIVVGNIKKSRFDTSGLTNEQLLSDQYSIELSGIKVTKSPKCKEKK